MYFISFLMHPTRKACFAKGEILKDSQEDRAECVTDLNYKIQKIIFGSILITFKIEHNFLKQLGQ